MQMKMPVELIQSLEWAAKKLAENFPTALSLNDEGYWTLNSKLIGGGGQQYFWWAKDYSTMMVGYDLTGCLSNGIHCLYEDVFQERLDRNLVEFNEDTHEWVVHFKSHHVPGESLEHYFKAEWPLHAEIIALCVHTEHCFMGDRSHV